MLVDEKEIAEHVMLVDLGRNDVGRVATPGTVRVDHLAHVERFSHLMHLVSHVDGELRDGLDAFDAFDALFPAGTLTGAPKVRAMELIDEFEPVYRGPYGGAVGYFSLSGNADFAITIRTRLPARRRRDDPGRRRGGRRQPRRLVNTRSVSTRPRHRCWHCKSPTRARERIGSRRLRRVDATKGPCEHRTLC